MGRKGRGVRTALVAVALIDALPGQPRQHFAGIDELAQSIRDHGILEPLLLRPVSARYQIVAGERRLRAARAAGLTEVPAVIRETTESEAFTLALVENIQRENLSPLEEAEAFQRLQREGKTQAQVGKLVGKTQSYVAQKLRLLTLPDFVSVFLESDDLTEGHARQLLRIRDVYPADFLDLWRGTSESGLKYAPMIFDALRPQAMERQGWDSVPPVAVDALRRLNGYVTRHRTSYGPPNWSKAEVPSWSITALWFAADAVRSGRSVAALSDRIGTWLSDLDDSFQSEQAEAS